MDINIAHLVVWYVVFVFSTTCHEAAHALAAYKGGDPTAYEGGQVSLDPLPHIQREPVGMVFVPIISFILSGDWMIGWASAPFDPEWGRRHPTRQALMSLAGPTANLLLAIIAFGALRGLLAAHIFVPPHQASFTQMVDLHGHASTRSPLGALAMALSIMLNLNVLLGLFNLLPIPPLDGAGVVQGLSPRRAGALYAMLRETPMMALLGLIAAWKVFGYIVIPVFSLTLAALHPQIRYH